MPVNTVKGSIPAGQSISPVINCSAGKIIQINTPKNGWDPANITFQVSPDGVTFNDFYLAEGGEVMLGCQPNRAIAVRPQNWPAGRYLKVRSGSAAFPIVQSAAREFEFVVDTQL